MQLSELRTFARLYTSNLKAGKLENTELDNLLRLAVKIVSQETECLTGETSFNADADIATYKISTIADDFCKMHESGLYYNFGDATTTQWQQLEPVTKAWLDSYNPDWTNADSGSPEYYFVEGDNIVVYPAPSSSLTNGFKLNHYRYPTAMVQDTDYPFEEATRIPHLEVLDDCIFAYIKWKASPIVGDNQTENVYEAEFYREIVKKREIIKSRADLSGYQSTNRNRVKFRGPRV